jgi:hypothetical protein
MAIPEARTLPCQLDPFKFYHIWLIAKSGKKLVKSTNKSILSTQPRRSKNEQQ